MSQYEAQRTSPTRARYQLTCQMTSQEPSPEELGEFSRNFSECRTARASSLSPSTHRSCVGPCVKPSPLH
jgi:hypothetical protein